jgi:hypothetical protein
MAEELGLTILYPWLESPIHFPEIPYGSVYWRQAVADPSPSIKSSCLERPSIVVEP